MSEGSSAPADADSCGSSPGLYPIVTKIPSEGQASLSSSIAEVMFRKVDTVHVNQEAPAFLHLFAKDEVGLIIDDAHRLVGFRTKVDLLDHLTSTVEAR